MSYCSADKVVNGIMNYADQEVINKLPGTGKWIMGVALNLAAGKIDNIVDALINNPIVQTLEIVDEEGSIDVDTLIDAMKTSADKYGKVTFDVPMVGRLTFSGQDMANLKNYFV